MRTLLILSALLLSLSATPAAFPQCQVCPEQRTLSVTASATVTAPADLAIVRVGYKLYGPDAKSVYTTASDTSNAIMQALLQSGVPHSSIESSSQVLQHTPPYEIQQFPAGSQDQVQRQFTIAQSWTVRVPPEEAAKALNTAIDAGANESGWIEWVAKNPTILQGEAATQALENAHAIAAQMARGSNVQLGHLVSVNQNQVIPGIAAGSGSVGGPMATDAVSQPLAITSRELEYTVTVFAVYAIE